MTALLTLPPAPLALLTRLEQAGYETWVVGGCVRDSLRGVPPHDWDLCTAATPDQVAAALEGLRIVPTGLAHGTVTAVVDGQGYEITTFRTEEGYADHRHPDRVAFVPHVEPDLARRDFTVNAMAYHPARGVCDPFGGRVDLAAGVLRCVGDPLARFDEDALRLLRALRFASQLDLTIEAATAAAVRARAGDLRGLPGERLGAELIKLLCGPAVTRVLLDFWPVFAVLIPALAPLHNAPQDNPHHAYTMDRHTAVSVGEIPPRPALRLCMLFHDVGKPLCRTLDENGVAHYYGHPARSAELAADALRALRVDNATAARVVALVRHHDDRFPPDPVGLKRRLRRWGPEVLRDLLLVQRADAVATGTEETRRDNLARLAAAEQALDALLAEEACFRLSDLALTGRDLLDAGWTPGPAVGACLDRLLDAVIDGRLPNRREDLLAAAGPFKEDAP